MVNLAVKKHKSPIPYEGTITVHDRFIYQSVTRAMQGNIPMALIELITNSNDSYSRLGQKDRKIIITYKKDHFKGLFGVKDDAEGQSLEDFDAHFTKYWKPTEVADDDSQRGYFGKGAKDALGYMSDGQIASFKDGRFILCTIFFDEEHIMRYKVLKDCKASPELRKKYDISGNGTFVSFVADPQSDKKVKVPQFNTLYEELSNHYLLRKMLKDTNLKLLLVNLKGRQKDKRRLVYVDPKGSSISSDSFEIKYGEYPTFVVKMEVSRSDTTLSQRDKGDTRQGGLLIIDEKGVVLDITLGKYDYDPVASKLFGEVEINGFRKMLKNGEIVLSPERDGLIKNHPFVESLMLELNKRLDSIVQREKDRLQRFDITGIGKEYHHRQLEFCKALNEIAAGELQFKDEDGDVSVTYPINAFAITPDSSQVSANSHTVFRLIIDTKKVPSGTIIDLESTNSTIKFENKNDKVMVPYFHKERDGKRSDKGNIVIAHITAKGSKANESGKIIAKAPDRTATASIFITPPDDIKDGLAFQFDNFVIAPNHPRKVTLFAVNKRVRTGDEIVIESDNKHIHAEPEKIVVNESTDTIKHGLLQYEVEVWGEGEGQEGIIIATCDTGRKGVCECGAGVKIMYKTPANDRIRSSIFTPHEYRSDPEPPQPASYSSEMEKVFVYTRFPTVSFYLGEHLENMYSLPAQVYIANLVIERYFYQLAFKAIDNSGIVLSERNKYDAIQRKKNELMSKYGVKLLNILVDQKLLKKSFKEQE